VKLRKNKAKRRQIDGNERHETAGGSQNEDRRGYQGAGGSAEGEVGTTESQAGYTVYASETPKYKLPSEGRDAFVEWVLADDEAEQQIDPEHKQLIRDRIEIFGNTLKKDPIDDYRLETGAESIGKEGIKGGKLPAGIQLHVEKKVNFRKSA